MKNVINLEHHYLPWQLNHKLNEFVQYYNHQGVHESLDNLTPADVYCGRTDYQGQELGQRTNHAQQKAH